MTPCDGSLRRPDPPEGGCGILTQIGDRKNVRHLVDPREMGGVPCVRGLRMPVATVVGMVAEGMSVQDILCEHPTLEPEDVREALQYAAEAVRESPRCGDARRQRGCVWSCRGSRRLRSNDAEFERAHPIDRRKMTVVLGDNYRADRSGGERNQHVVREPTAAREVIVLPFLKPPQDIAGFLVHAL